MIACRSSRQYIGFLIALGILFLNPVDSGKAEETLSQAAAQAAPQNPATEAESAHDLNVGVGKSVVVNTSLPIERVSVGFGEIAEATAVGPREVLVNGRAPGETSLIIWQVNGPKLFFEVTVRPSSFVNTSRLDSLRRQLRQELPGQNLTPTIENDTVFLRGTVKDLTAADRAVAIAGTFGKTVNLLYVNVPSTAAQILLKVQFATIDRTISSQLGLNLVSGGATNTVGSVSTQQYSPPTVVRNQNGSSTITVSDALNIFLLRPDLNLAATIKALESKALVQILAEPNVLAINGKQASFLAGGEFPYPVLQSAGVGGASAVTVQFREFGVRINFIPTVTPRGTILLDVAPEVSALDFAAGLTIQGFTIPALTSRKVRTEVELQQGQSFAIGGLLDKRLTETVEKIPLLGDIPLLGKIFRSRNLNKENTELLVIVTPELVQPIPAGQKTPELNFPAKFLSENSPGQTRTPGMDKTGVPPSGSAQEAMPVEKLIESMKTPELTDRGNERNIISVTPYPAAASPAGAPAAPATPAPPVAAPATAPSK